MEFSVYTISVRGLLLFRHYEIYRDDVLVYRVKKPSFLKFREMYFTDLAGNEILKIYRHVAIFVINYKFVFSQNGKPIAKFERKGFDNYYTSSSIYGEHTVQGDFFNREYTVFNDDGEIAKVSRKRFRSHKKYGVAIIKGNNELYILAMIIAISIVNARRKNKG